MVSEMQGNDSGFGWDVPLLPGHQEDREDYANSYRSWSFGGISNGASMEEWLKARTEWFWSEAGIRETIDSLKRLRVNRLEELEKSKQELNVQLKDFPVKLEKGAKKCDRCGTVYAKLTRQPCGDCLEKPKESFMTDRIKSFVNSKENQWEEVPIDAYND